jgi:hypothetical protein
MLARQLPNPHRPLDKDHPYNADYARVSDEHGNGGCMWSFGNHLPGAADFGRNAQYGSLLTSTYLAFGGRGATIELINNFRQIISNPCLAGGSHV